jgi:putative ABC transport system permease protein
MLLESLKMALASLRANKMRALLTMLGIIVGIASVIAIVSLGEGGKNEVLGQFDQIGGSTVIIRVRTSQAQAKDYITQSDLEAIRARTDLIKHVTASVQTMASGTSEDQQSRIYLAAIDEEYTSFVDIDLIYGRLFTDIEYTDARPVVIIDKSGAVDLFGRENAVGETLTLIKGGKLVRTTVIGICESITSQMTSLMASYGMDTSEATIPFFVYSPFRTAQRVLGSEDKLTSVNIMATSAQIADDAGAAVIRLLEMRHGNSDRDVYRSQNMASILNQINNVINILTIFISAVAAISLLVGGIGVMNIMLVSVTERTREIGIRKAIGATTTDIMLQFMTESVIMTLIGGIIGILTGFGMAYGIAWAVRSIGQITPVLNIQTIVIAVLFASSVGLFFGIYPARKAALLDPIDALRYE